MADHQFQEGLPPAFEKSELAGEASPDVPWIVCPECGQRTDSLKLYDNSVFRWQNKVVLSCPSCMRRAIKIRALFLPFTFIFAPLYAWILIQDYRESRRQGHSPEALEEMKALSAEVPFEEALQEINLRRPPRKERNLLLILVGVIACLWIIPFALKSEPEVDGKTLTEWQAQLRSQDPQNREEAALKIKKMGPEARKVDQQLYDMVRTDPERNVRRAALLALEEINPRLAWEAFQWFKMKEVP